MRKSYMVLHEGEIALNGFIEIDEYKLAYTIEGMGPVLLIIGSAIFYPRVFSQNLRSKFTLVFIDHRGFAEKTNGASTEVNLVTVLDDCEFIRQKLNLGKVLVLGHSGHGYMALEYAKKFKENIAGVILIALGPDQSAHGRKEAEQYLQDTVCPERKQALKESFSNLENDIIANPDQKFITLCLALGPITWFDYNYDAKPLWKDVKVNMDIIDYFWTDFFTKIDINQNLENFDKPVFLALGIFDYLVTPFYSWNKIRKNFQNISVKLFERSGHNPQFEESNLFDTELLLWFESNFV